MATIGWIKIGLTTDTSKFVSGLHKGLRGLEKSLDQAKAAIAGLGAALGVYAMAEFVHRSTEAAAETKTLAERLGFSAESFAKLSYAARLSHVDQETFAHSLEKMNERLAEVAMTGEGPAADMLRRFGVSARQLVAMGPEKAFETLLGVFDKIQNPMERAKVAMDLFGKSGQGMINLAARGSAGIKALGAEASALHVAPSDEEIQKLAETDAQFLRIQGAIEGVGNSIAVGLAPFITAVADQFIEWMKSGTQTTSYVSQGLDMVTDAFGFAADAAQVLQTGFYYIRSTFNMLAAAVMSGIDGMIQGFGWLYEKITGTKLELTKFFKEWSDGLEASAVADLNSAEETWNKKWGHERVKEFVDELQAAATNRAQFNVDKSKQFANAGALLHPKVVEPGFGGAFEFGSKEAYSSIVKSRAMQSTTLQNKIESNTRLTAEATRQSAAALSRMQQLLGQNSTKDGEQGRQLTASP